jgi:serine/threonine-protein kinase RsbW
MGVAKSICRHSARPPSPSPRRRGTSARKAAVDNGAGGTSRSLNSNKPLKFTIDSDFAQGRDVQGRILEDVERIGGFDEHSVFAIKLALEEALINAIKHGNKMDPAKKVHIEANIKPHRAEIQIEDEGPGFDRSSVPDPTAEENLCKCSGRGILLMESYMTTVKWTNNGRRVQMIKVREDDAVK